MNRNRKGHKWGIHINRTANDATEYLDFEFVLGRETNLQAEHYFAATAGDTTMAAHWTEKIKQIGMSPVTPYHGAFLDRQYGNPRFTIRWFAGNGRGVVGPQRWHSPSVIEATPCQAVVDALGKLMRVKRRQPGDSMFHDLPVEVALVALKPMHVTRHEESGLWLQSDVDPQLLLSPAEQAEQEQQESPTLN